jgi:hypothetical protein
MHLDLSDEEAAALTQERYHLVENDHYPFSPRIRTLKGILAKLGPEPVRQPLPRRRRCMRRRVKIAYSATLPTKDERCLRTTRLPL